MSFQPSTFLVDRENRTSWRKVCSDHMGDIHIRESPEYGGCIEVVIESGTEVHLVEHRTALILSRSDAESLADALKVLLEESE